MSQRGEGPPVGPLLALVGWCGVFAVPHVYWALGGRAGLGAEAAAADAALASPGFAAYNAATVIACVAGVLLGIGDLTGRTRLAARWRGVLLVLAVLLALRGVVGVLGLAVAALGGGIDSPPVLVAVEGWFLLGSLVLAWLWRSVSTRGVRRNG